MDYTKLQKINALCEERNFTGTNQEKLEFVTKLEQQEEISLAKRKAQIQAQILDLQTEFTKLPATARMLLNRRAIRLLRQKETETLLSVDQDL